MIWFFRIFSVTFFLCAAVFAAGGVAVIAGGMPGVGVLVLACAAMCGMLGEGCRGAARREQG